MPPGARDIQVLWPMNRGGVGARSLNIEQLRHPTIRTVEPATKDSAQVDRRSNRPSDERFRFVPTALAVLKACNISASALLGFRRQMRAPNRWVLQQRMRAEGVAVDHGRQKSCR